MNTFFRISIYLCIMLLLITLSFSLINSFDAFGYTTEAGVEISSTDEYLGELTTLDETDMNYIWGLFLGAGTVIGIGIGAVTHSIAPVGIGIFGGVFWGSLINTHVILSTGNYIPPELMTIFTICSGFIFVAALVGMTTGSG